MSPGNVLKPVRVRLSLTEAEARNAPNSLYAPLDPLSDLLPPADAPALAALPAGAAPSVITVTGPEADATPPVAEEFRGPPTEEATATPATAIDLTVPPGDPLTADILWDPATAPAESSVSGADPVAAEPPAGPSDAAAVGGPEIASESSKDGDDGAEDGETEPALLADPDESEEAGGEAVDGDAGEGHGLMSSWSSIGAPSGDLDIVTSGGAVYDDAKELNPGGWVAVNNDNDNYNFDTSDKTIATKQIYDKDDKGTVEWENDLVGIVVTAATPSVNPGKFGLYWASPNIKVYKSADRAQPVTSGVEVVAKQNFYVEGVAMSGVAGAEQITLEWIDPSGGRGAVDTVAFTVYEVQGPLNVPGYSKHTYSVRTPDLRTSTIDTVTGGTPDPTTAVDKSSFTTSRDILWNNGPVFGTYKATPVAGEPFWSDREVNVVGVNLGFANASNLLKTNNEKVEQLETLEGVYSCHVDAKTDPRRAMTATLPVGSIIGPGPKGPEVYPRGVRFIEAGLVQVIRYTHMHGDFNNSDPPFRRVAGLEGLSFLDANATARPWYNEGCYYRGPLDDFPGNVGPTLTLLDNPKLPGTDVLTVVPGSAELVLDPTVTAVPKELYNDKKSTYDDVDFFAIVADFDTYTVVHTVETVNDADKQYTIRGKGTWQFNGSGHVKVADGTKAGDKSLPLAERHVWAKQVATPNTTGGAGATTSKFGGVLSPLHGREGDPLTDGPHVIGELGGHR